MKMLTQLQWIPKTLEGHLGNAHISNEVEEALEQWLNKNFLALVKHYLREEHRNDYSKFSQKF